MAGFPNGTTQEGYRFFAETDYSRGGVAIHAVQLNPRDGTGKVATIVWEDKPAYEITRPMLAMYEDGGQALFDALWAYGFRPRETVLPDALTAAKDEHIKDLRQIVGKLFDKV
jgi:hypothetical protein